jgi:hypothetical protein
MGRPPYISHSRYSSNLDEYKFGNHLTSLKKIDSIDVMLRYNVNPDTYNVRSSAESATLTKNTVSFNINENEYHSNRQPHEILKKPLPNPDERPIRQGNFSDVYGASDASYDNQRINTTRSVDQRPILQSFSNVHHLMKRSVIEDCKSERSDTMTCKTVGNMKNKNNANEANFLRKRSNLKYDPIKAVKLDKQKTLNDTTSQCSKSKYNDVKSKIDSGLHKPSSPKSRTEFRKGGSNSQIIQKRKSTNSTISKVAEDMSKNPNKFSYNSSKDMCKPSQLKLKGKGRSK